MATLLFLALTAAIRGENPTDREPGYGFFIMNRRSSSGDVESWCLAAIPAPDGTDITDKEVVLELCNLEDKAYLPHLWKMDGGRIQSALDSDCCLTVLAPNNFLVGARIRLLPCHFDQNNAKIDDDNSNSKRQVHQQFVYRSTRGQLRIQEEYCVTTNQGTAPNSGDRIFLLPCEDQDRRFLWVFQANPVPFGFFPIVIIHEEGGHIIVKNHRVNEPGESLQLGSLTGWEGNQWWMDEHGLFHSAINSTMCMQAGHSIPKDGTKMRIEECDKNNSLQKFEWDKWGGPIQPRDNLELCVTFRGQTPHVDKDPIILKECHKLVGGNRMRWFED